MSKNWIKKRGAQLGGGSWVVYKEGGGVTQSKYKICRCDLIHLYSVEFRHFSLEKNFTTWKGEGDFETLGVFFSMRPLLS